MSYRIAKTLASVLEALKDKDPAVRFVAGATDLFLQEMPAGLVDISSIEELIAIEEIDDRLVIGAAVTHARAAASELIKSRAAALAEACLQIGSPQVRNIGTLGGNVVNAAPAADAAVALIALGAKAVLVDSSGAWREEAVDHLYRGYNCSVLDGCTELLVRFLIEPCGQGEGSAFRRFAARKALALPMANAAARLKLENGVVASLSLVAAPVGPAPTRLSRTETVICGRTAGEETWILAAEMAAEEVEVRGSLLRCSAAYRRHLIGILTGDALRAAARRASENPEI